jgi:MFS family permease
MYVVAFLDRANIGFAKQALHTSAGISNATYAMGAGLFFLTYAILEVPSNLIMHRVGARVWMCRIMVSWGLVSMGTMFVEGPRSFYALRLLLGIAEAGFFPGVILYLSYWFPNRVKGQVLGLFYFGAPLAFIAGGPLSGMLLQMSPRAGLHGWQWMFLLEGLLSVSVGIWAYWYLGDKPQDASWLPDAEKQALLGVLRDEEETRRRNGSSSFPGALRDWRVLYYAGVYFLIQMSVYGVIFYLPAEIAVLLRQSIGIEVGFVSAIPWICAVVATLWISRAADRHSNHRVLAAWALLVSGLASILFPTSGPAIALAALCIAASGLIAVQPLFWTVSMNSLAGTAAAGGIAFINAIGALGGFVAPNAKVWADVRFGSSRTGLYLLAVLTLFNAALVAILRQRKTFPNQAA